MHREDINIATVPTREGRSIVGRVRLALSGREVPEPQASCPCDSPPTASKSAAISPLPEGEGAGSTATRDSVGLKTRTVLVGVTEVRASGCRTGQAPKVRHLSFT